MSRTERALQTLHDLLRQSIEPHLQANANIYDLLTDNISFAFGLPDLRRATEMPLVCIDLDTSEHAQLTLGTPGNAKRRISIPANIHCFCAGRERETLFRQILQLTDCIITLLESIPQHNEYIYQSPRLVDFAPAIESQSQVPYIAVATISLNIQQIVISTQS